MIKKRNDKKSNVIVICIMVVMAGVFLFSGYKLFDIWWGYHEGAKVHNEVHDIFYGQGNVVMDKIQSGERKTVKIEEETLDETIVLIDSAEEAQEVLAPLEAQNSDTVGWITIPDTKMDYVIMHGVTNNTYLYTNFYRQRNSGGCIFLDAENQLGAPLQNLIIYGHHMKDGSMFHDLDLYKDEEWYKEHPTFTLILEDGVYDCEIYACILCTINDDLWHCYFESEDEKEEYIEFSRNLALYATDVEVTGKDMIVTLSTCEYTKGDQIGRMLIQAKMVKRWYEADSEEAVQ